MQREWWKAIRKASAPQRDTVLKSWGWVRVRSPEGLAAVATLPGRSQRPVVVYFFAKWSALNGDLERQVLSDPAVRERLREFTMVYVDVTEPGAEQKEMKKMLDGEIVPKVHVFRTGSGLAASLLAGEEPAPEGSIDEVVGVREFLVMLDSVSG
ncbi:MAG: hypothetical protein ACRBN8_45795 [Nannocystales bacterium]